MEGEKSTKKGGTKGENDGGGEGRTSLIPTGIWGGQNSFLQEGSQELGHGGCGSGAMARRDDGGRGELGKGRGRERVRGRGRGGLSNTYNCINSYYSYILFLKSGTWALSVD